MLSAILLPLQQALGLEIPVALRQTLIHEQPALEICAQDIAIFVRAVGCLHIQG